MIRVFDDTAGDIAFLKVILIIVPAVYKLSICISSFACEFCTCTYCISRSRAELRDREMQYVHVQLCIVQIHCKCECSRQFVSAANVSIIILKNAIHPSVHLKTVSILSYRYLIFTHRSKSLTTHKIKLN